MYVSESTFVHLRQAEDERQSRELEYRRIARERDAEKAAREREVDPAVATVAGFRELVRRLRRSGRSANRRLSHP